MNIIYIFGIGKEINFSKKKQKISYVEALITTNLIYLISLFERCKRSQFSKVKSLEFHIWNFEGGNKLIW